MHYLFLNAWFLEAERVRSVEATDYGLVGSALSQNSFIILMKAMRESSERGELHSVDTVFTSMMFFKQILLAVNDMDYKGSEEAKEISENMKSRLFYEASSLDVLIHLPRNANKYSNAYLKECIELCHITLKTLEAYSKQHTTLFVKSKRQKMRKKRKNGEPITDDQDYGESEDEEKESARVTLERKFEFAKFESRFINENTIDSYVKFLSNFRELTAREIKWVISFFHRCFVKREARTVFFRLDIMRLLQMMTSSSKGLIHKNESRHDVERFTIYYVNKLTTALERTPSLFAELLFNKMPESIFYFDNGYDKVKEQKDRKNEWDFRDADIDEERKYAIIVAALLDEDKNNMAEWAVIKIGEIREKRARWIEMNTAMHIENSSDEPPPEIPDEVMLVEGGDREFLKDGKFELLLKLIGFKIDRSKQSMVLSSSISQSSLELAEKYIKRYLFESVDFGEMVAVDLLKKKNQIEYRTESESETDMRGEMDDFVTNDADDQDRDKNSLNSSGFNDSRFDALPDDERLAKKLSIMKRLHPLEKKKSKKGSKRAKVNESEKDARKTQRALEEAQKRKRIKSSAFVSDSDTDEERDKEFFERERLLRERMANNSFVNSQVSIEGKHSQRVPTLSPEPSSTAVGDSSDAVFDTIHGSEGSVVESNEELSLFVTDEEVDVATTQIRQRKRNIVLSDDENEDES